MHYAFTFFGVLLKAVTVALLQLFGKTYTSDSVSKAVTFISIIFIIIGVVMATIEESGKELIKVYIKHAIIVVLGFVIVWLLTWSLIIGFGVFALGIMFVYFFIFLI